MTRFKTDPNLPLRIANNTRNFFVRNFNRQQWEGVRWKEVKRRIEGTNEYKYPKTRKLSRRINPILVGSGGAKGQSGGALRRAVANSIRSYNWREIRLGITSDVPYAIYHNNGDGKIPKRRFIGPNKELTASNHELIRASVKASTEKALRNAFGK